MNRDDGRFYRVGNTSLGPLSIIGGLAVIASLILSQLLRHADLHVAWPIAVGIVGVVLWLLGGSRDEPHDDT
ncbi:hypothetical protein [uncultured Pseudoxanthomonas sp.]|uniref:hypothetical protein n=1 Tax=uncultured Pseudoxanthomonas sp. TaxID=281701 RepID=UPI00261A6BFD|nr:hypothetical protein [uncultured Pseudoxanthomonas sp.]